MTNLATCTPKILGLGWCCKHDPLTEGNTTMRTYIENILDHLASHADQSIGSVDELGHFAVVSIPTDQAEREDFLSKLDDELALERDPNEPTLEGGWYIVLTDASGFIGYTLTDDEANATARFERIVAEYAKYYELSDR